MRSVFREPFFLFLETIEIKTFIKYSYEHYRVYASLLRSAIQGTSITDVRFVKLIFKPRFCTFKNYFPSILRNFLLALIGKIFISDTLAYCIVASRSTCYYSENQKFGFLKFRLLICHICFQKKKHFFVFKIES